MQRLPAAQLTDLMVCIPAQTLDNREVIIDNQFVSDLPKSGILQFDYSTSVRVRSAQANHQWHI